MKKPGNAGGAKARQEGGCVESMVKQAELPIVEETSKQGREAECQKWSWVEAEVWTQRMLTTLETGVKGGRWFSLIDKVYQKAESGSGVAKGTPTERSRWSGWPKYPEV